MTKETFLLFLLVHRETSTLDGELRSEGGVGK
jgi:hypothetical protein